ncbi:hypothetical protein CHS0354_037660 [Potamilus streckersoni]|uniref:CUB domain-containing protein n=1 Tax=Potamilus streckersoni TaxID=2493646 RepID=A0AAE0T7N5_9BIVA|nr:hypothetical protein CHS0354_037660 [Potamilus streckersoni]
MVPVHLILFLLAISVEGILAISPCNQTFTGNVTVSPGEIPTNVMNCTFNFSINPNSDTLMLVFSSLGCLSSGDNITISADSKIITTITSENDRVTVVSTSNFTVVTLLRGSGNKTLTFKLDYKKECTQEVDPSLGFLSSPKHLPLTKKIIKCTYNVISPEGQITLLGFTSFNFKSGSLNVNGINVTAGQNRTLPDDLLIPSNTAIILSLPSNENKTEEFISILSLVNDDCSNKTFSVYDNFIYTSSAGAVCHRMIDGPNGTLVVTVKSWQTDSLDILQFRDGLSQEDKPLISGSSVKDNIVLVSSGSKMSMHLEFKPTIKRRVEISFTSQASGGLVKVGSDITYISAMSGGKDGVFQCTLDAGKKVSLTNFNMSNNGTVEVYDGNIIIGNPVFTIKNTSLPIPVFMQTNQMTIVTKSVLSSYTFRATTGMAQDCDQFSQLALGSYAVKSLGPNDTFTCNLIILPMSKADYGGTIQLTSLDLCPGDKVTISEGITSLNAQKELVSFTYNSNYQFIPQLIFGADKGARIVTALSKCDKRQAGVVVAASYDMKTLSSVCGKQPQSPSGTVRSPYYPLRYPVNLECQWTFENKNNSFLYLTVDKLNITVGNSLKLTGDKTEFDFTADKTLGKDLIFSKSKDLILSLTSVSKDGTLVIPGEGFVINYEYLDCGGSRNANFSETFSGDKKDCRWIVSLPKTTQDSVNAISSVYIIKAKLKVSENYVPGSLTVYDGTNMTVNTLNLANLSSGKELTFLSRVDTIIIQYKNVTTKNFTLAVTITGYLCANFCQNGICMHDEWRCNNINDCGDNSDELHCSAPPPPSSTPSPQPKPAPKEDKGQVPGFWLAIMLIIGLIIGILLPFIIPAIFRRMRKRNYNRMTDMGNPEA